MPKKSTVKKTSAKTLKKTKPSAKSQTVVAPKESTPIEQVASPEPAVRRPVRIHKLTVIIAVIIILLGVLIYFGRGLFVAAVVNGQPISRLDLVQETERESGKQAMTTLIRNVLIEQEAAKQNVTATDKDVSDQIKTIEQNLSSQGQKLDQMLTLEGMTRDDLKKIVKQDVLVTKLVGKDIKISDKDVNDYIDKNKEFLPKDKKGNDLKNYVRDQLKRAQLPQKAQAWLAEIEKKAKIIKFVNL